MLAAQRLFAGPAKRTEHRLGAQFDWRRSCLPALIPSLNALIATGLSRPYQHRDHHLAIAQVDFFHLFALMVTSVRLPVDVFLNPSTGPFGAGAS